MWTTSIIGIGLILSLVGIATVYPPVHAEDSPIACSAWVGFQSGNRERARQFLPPFENAIVGNSDCRRETWNTKQFGPIIQLRPREGPKKKPLPIFKPNFLLGQRPTTQKTRQTLL